MENDHTVVSVYHPLQTGDNVLLEKQSEGGRVATVAAISDKGLCLRFSSSKGADPFNEEGRIRLYYWEARTIYCWTGKVVAIKDHLVVISVSGEGLTLESRKSLRFDLTVPFSWVIVEAKDKRLIGRKASRNQTINISVGGLKFETRVPLVEDDKLALNLHLSSTEQLDVYGWVVRSKMKEKDDGSLKEIGVEFFQIEEEQQKKLLQWLSEASR